MNGLRADSAARIDALVRHVGVADATAELAVCPPATLLHLVGRQISDAGAAIALGAQDCATAVSGAHTGDISASMLADIGCRYVIVGHSERRTDHGEPSDLVRAKAKAALDTGMCPIICVGETETERNAGQTLEVVGNQLDESIPDEAAAEPVVVAYEPVWAIGTGRTPTTTDVANVHQFVRDRLSKRLGDAGRAIRLLYGGSVKPDNAGDLMAVENVDGGLIGGASLKADDFWAICEAASAHGH